MGILDKLFGGEKTYPPLPQDNAVRAKLEAIKPQLEALAESINDHLEVVPADGEAFVFLGKPPKRFGIAWIHDGRVSSLKELATENKLSQMEVGSLVNKLGEAYEHAGQTPRYATALAGKQAVVIPSAGLEQEVRQIIQGAMQH
jgi:hypothetical protein